jgi:hypothetical protein
MFKSEAFASGAAFVPPDLPRIAPFFESWEGERTPCGESILIELSGDIVAPNVSIVMGSRDGVTLEEAIGASMKWAFRLGQRAESSMGRRGYTRGFPCTHCGIVGSRGSGFFLASGGIVCVSCGNPVQIRSKDS